MFEPPFEVVRCSWPRPVIQENGCWLSEPEWDAPPMPWLPQPQWEIVAGRPCFVIDWRETFRRGVRHGASDSCGDLCGFHVVFEIRLCAGGVLSFWDDDGSIIRRDGCTVHCDRTAHAMKRSEIGVCAGTLLSIAQWQFVNEWSWAGSFYSEMTRSECRDAVLRYRSAVEARLLIPEGPPLRVFTQGQQPLRTILAIYSMVLNGYCPSRIELFGEHQWDAATRELLQAALPSAEIHPTDSLLRSWSSLGGPALANLATLHWYVMKACLSLLSPPGEHCLLDDDVFVLDSVHDALEQFQHCDLVFSPDTNHAAAYLSIWSGIFANSPAEFPTARMNTGLLWLRPAHDPASLAQSILQGSHSVGIGAWAWEQGLFANVYANRAVHQLSSTRYLLPMWEGLPGGVLGYDYLANPCGFASIHFAGLWNKPCDVVAAWLAPQILSRNLRTEAGL